jgi:hypothetical protein
MTVAIVPVLQLVHVSDIHFKHCNANAVHPLAAKHRFVQRIIEKYNVGGWNEGTQGHYYKAPQSFEHFLAGWLKKDPRWIRTEDPDSAETWLIDSGDLTAFGDQGSIKLGEDSHQVWRTALHNCPTRRIYGNHDAWPGTQPLHGLFGLQPEIDKQQLRLASILEWNATNWIAKPISVPIPGPAGSRIELYAVNTVCWDAAKNAVALGEIDPTDIARLRAELSARSTVPTYRILVMHHPLAYPYTFKQRHFPAMVLVDADRWTRELRNDPNVPPGIGPLAHLFLGGHTHVAYPADPLPGNDSDIHQGLLLAHQVQLVAGPLMLNQSAKAARAQAQGATFIDEANRKNYYPTTTNAHTCQAQILQFFADTTKPGLLKLFRVPIYSFDGGASYEPAAASEVTLAY